MEGWKDADDRDLRRDFPWEMIGNDNHPLPQQHKEREIYEWTRALIQLRKKNAAVRYGTTITLWSDDLVYAFLRIGLDDVVLIVINNGYAAMPEPIELILNPDIIPGRVINMISGGLKHWQTNTPLTM